jgi:hypothetical protein
MLKKTQEDFFVVPHDHAVKILFASQNTRTRSGFITVTIAVLLLAFSPDLHAQSSPLTVQPSMGRAGVGLNTIKEQQASSTT